MSERGTRRTMPRFYYATRWLFPKVCSLLRIKISVHGAERVPVAGPLVLVSNHTSVLDVPLVSFAVPRDVVFMSKVENSEGNRLHGWIVDNYGAFPIRRGEMDVGAIRQALGVLAEGRALFVAPEGTRHPDGVLGEPFLGAAMLAQRKQTTIVPIGISGAHQFQERLRRWEPMHAEVRIGPPFYLQPGLGRANRPEMSEAIMEQIAQLLPPANRGRFTQLSEAQRFVVPT